MNEFAMFTGMGTGKTYMTINLAWRRFEAGLINKLLIVCDSPIRNVWVHEFHKHIESDYEHIQLFKFNSGDNKKFERWEKERPETCLGVLIIGIQGLSQGKLYDLIKKWPDDNTMMVIDESSDIKTPGSKRTEKCWYLGGRAEYRMILTGTPLGNGFEDYYAQYKFLHSGILGSNFTTFKKRYCKEKQIGDKEDSRGQPVTKIVSYKNEEELLQKIAPYTYELTKEEALPHLEPKEFQVIPVDPTKEQLRAFSDLKRSFMAEDDGDVIEIETLLERTIRYQQIAGGHFPFENEDGKYDIKPISGTNPKIEAMVSYFSHMPPDAKAIIWAQFIPEIELVSERFREQFGEDSVLEFYGAIDEDARAQNTLDFQDFNHPSRFMISNKTGAKGQTWTAAAYVGFYSNSHSYINRVQSEDRAHRDGQENKVHYVDFILQHRDSDINVFNAIKKKQSLAEYASENLREFM